MFAILRFLITIFELIVNDLYYFYHQFNFILWSLFTVINIFAYLIVLSNYQELNDLTKLQSIIKEKANSVNMSRSFLQDTSHLNGLNTISSKLNQSINSTPSHSICSSTISESFDRADFAFQKQLIQQQKQLEHQKMQQIKLDQVYNQLKESRPPLQSFKVESL